MSPLSSNWIAFTKLWARRNIEDAEVGRTLREITTEDADKRIVGLALNHHLVTRLTSLVAIDRTPSRPEGAHLSRAELPLSLPAGWDFDKVFGKRRMVPNPSGERRADGGPAVHGTPATSLAPASPDRAAVVIPVAQTDVTLPKTATDAELRMMIGLMLCAMSLALLFVRRWWACGFWV